MNKSLSRSFKNEFGNQYDEAIADRVKHLISKDKSVWEDWDIQFMGTIKMIQGDDETAILEKSDIVIKKLKAAKTAGKLTLSLLPKFKAKDISPIMDEILLRGSNMDYHPILRLNLTGTSINGKMMRVLVNTILDHTKYPYLQWLNFTQSGLKSTTSNKKKKDEQKGGDEQKDELYGLSTIDILAVGLKKNKTLKFLHLNKNPSIKEDGFKTILESITNHPSLRCLWYNSNRMNAGHTKILGEWLSTNPNLPRISMEHNGITDVMFIDVVDGLAKNKTVFELNVAKNDISDEGMAAFRFVDRVFCVECIPSYGGLNYIALKLL